MRLNTPQFWYKRFSPAALTLAPFSVIYRAAQACRQKASITYRANMPVICVGNLVAGGSGKTPVSLGFMEMIKNTGLAQKPCFLSRGYGGSEQGPLFLDQGKHTARHVGDEPFLLAEKAPVIIGGDRAKSAKLATDKGFDLLLMDDGLQNPGLYQDIKLVVIDGLTGFGNHWLLPAGPLREPLKAGLQKADAFVLIGDDNTGVRDELPADKPVFAAKIGVSQAWQADKQMSYIAFSGLAHPEKFSRTLEEQNIKLAAWHPFPDHYRFSAEDLDRLAREARSAGARLITTAKDAARISDDFMTKNKVEILPVEISWEDEKALQAFIKERLEDRGRS